MFPELFQVIPQLFQVGPQMGLLESRLALTWTREVKREPKGREGTQKEANREQKKETERELMEQGPQAR